MKCTECQKQSPTIHFTRYVNGTKQEYHLCQSCASKYDEVSLEEGYTLHELLTGLFNFDANKMDINMNNIKQNDERELICSNCNLSFREFRKIGKFGCSDCYTSFESKLTPIFKRVHSGNTNHTGKIPKRTGVKLHQKKKLIAYRKYLEKLILDENFEEAAIIRDKIKAIEETNGEQV